MLTEVVKRFKSGKQKYRIISQKATETATPYYIFEHLSHDAMGILQWKVVDTSTWEDRGIIISFLLQLRFYNVENETYDDASSF